MSNANPYGTDVSWFPDLDPNLSLIGGNAVLAQAIYCRLSTPRGTFSWDPEYGLDVRSLLNATIYPNTLGLWQRQIETECEKDERIVSASCVITQINQTTLRIAITGQGSQGPFTAVLGVTGVTVSLLTFT